MFSSMHYSERKYVLDAKSTFLITNKRFLDRERDHAIEKEKRPKNPKPSDSLRPFGAYRCPIATRLVERRTRLSWQRLSIANSSAYALASTNVGTSYTKRDAQNILGCVVFKCLQPFWPWLIWQFSCKTVQMETQKNRMMSRSNKDCDVTHELWDSMDQTWTVTSENRGFQKKNGVSKKP